MDALLNKAALVLTFALQVLILAILVKRQLRQRFSWFLIYIIYEIVESASRFSLIGQQWYFTVYWWTEIGDVLFMILAVRESFLNVFRGYTRLRSVLWFIWSCIALSLLYAIFESFVLPPVESNRRGMIIIDVEVAVDIVLMVVCVLFIVLYKLFRIRGQQWETGIISGFSIYVCLSICGFLATSIFGTRFNLLNEWLAPIGYLLAEMTWALELSRKEKLVTVPTRNLTIDDLTTLNQYIRTLMRLLGRKE